MKNRIVLILFFIINASFLVAASEKNVYGKVTTFDSIPIIGASIQLKSSKQIVYTDSLGMFTISCLQKDKLKVTANGFSGKHVKITKNTQFIPVNLNLKQGEENREMAISNGHVKDKDKLYAISSIINNGLDFSHYTNIYDIIKSRFPEVEVSGGEIIIRGTSSFIASNAALLVVDGVVVDKSFFDNILPVEIASINILKDAGASEYGSRGANGVVLVQTKVKGDF